MKIVYVSREFGPITGGGIGTYIGNVCRSMLEAGHEVFLLSDCVTPETEHKLPEGLKVVDLKPVSSELAGGFFSYNHEYSQRVFETLLPLYEKEHFDVAEFAEYCGEGFISIRAKRLMNQFADAKLVVKCHTPLSLLEHINEDYLYDAQTECDIEMEDYCIRNADLVTSPSLSLGEYFAKRIGRKDIVQCPYPLYLDFNENEKPWTEKHRKTVRFLGSVQVRKGVDTFIDAAVRILDEDPDFQFEIYGKERNAAFFNRNYTDVLKSRIPEKYIDKIVFKGGVEYEKVAGIYHESVICVLPSRWENWANACLEGMAMGCVMLASRSGGMGEMIEDDISGYRIDPLDPEALAERILSIHSDTDKLKSISKAAIQRARELTDPVAITERILSNYSIESSGGKTAKIRDEAEPLVSIIVPFYNQVGTIDETLQSIRESSYKNIEILLVNDGSTSPSACKYFDELDASDIRKIDKPNGGLSSARNKGISEAKGEYILPLDSDDKLHSLYIEKAVKALGCNEELGYVSCYTKNFGAFDSAYNPVGNVDTLMPFLNTNGKCTNLYRKSVFEKAGGYDENMNSYEDWDFLLTLNDHGIEGDVLPDALFFYRRNYASMVFSVANQIRANLIQYMLKKHRATWEKHSYKVSQILLRLWKDTEIREEQSVCDVLQIYWAEDAAFSEPNSVSLSFDSRGVGKGAGLFEYSLPWTSRINTLRIDPCNRSGQIFIKEVRICDLETNEVLFVTNAAKDFDGIEAVGTVAAPLHVEADYGVIDSVGEDPQLFLRCDEMLGKECKLYIQLSVKCS